MHPVIIQALSAERDREFREHAAARRRARESRRCRRPLARIRWGRWPLRVPAAA